jgi:hypothetical protein
MAWRPGLFVNAAMTRGEKKFLSPSLLMQCRPSTVNPWSS